MVTDAFRREQRDVALAMASALTTTLVVLCSVAMCARPPGLIPFAARLQSAMRVDLWVIVWLAAAIANVARLRFLSVRDIAGGSAEDASDTVRIARAILQNTTEQVVLAIGAHLAVAATFDRSTALVAALAGLFAVGRLLFWLGYKGGARGRAFGFALTFYPSLVALAACIVATTFGWSGS